MHAGELVQRDVELAPDGQGLAAACFAWGLSTPSLPPVTRFLPPAAVAVIAALR